MKIGMITDCMKKENLDAALEEAHRLNVDGVQIFAVGGEFSPATLTVEKKEHFSIAGGIINWSNHSGNQFGSSSENWT